MYTKLQSYVKAIYQGTTAINRLSQAEECGRLAGGPRLLEATLVASGSFEPIIKDQIADPREKDEQIEALVQYAYQNNLLYEHTDFQRLGTYLDNGAEQYVYMFNYRMYVTKINRMCFHESPLEYFDRLALHNYLFPEAPYTLVGFTESYPEESRFCAVVTQPFVIADRGAEREEVKIEMEKMGFVHKLGNTYISRDYIVEDLHPGNALLTPNGNIAIIDPVIYLNTSFDEYEGTREYHESLEISNLND